MRIQWVLLGVLLSSVLLLAACGNTAPSYSAPPIPVRSVEASGASVDVKKPERAKNEVLIDNFTFTPAELTVERNATVTWINHDDIPHTVKDTQKRFLSPTLDTDEKFSFTFKEPGTYDYFCTIHNHMTGKIIVK